MRIGGLAALIALIAIGIAHAQLPEGLPQGLPDQPAALGVANPTSRIERRLEALKEQRKDLQSRQTSDADWRAREKALAERLEILTARRARYVQDSAPTLRERRWKGLTPRPAPRTAPRSVPPTPGPTPGPTPDTAPGTIPGTIPDAVPGTAPSAAPASKPRSTGPTRLPLVEVIDDGGYQEGYLIPGIHPAELTALDGLIDTLDVGRQRYESLLQLHWDERVQLNQAIADGRALLESLEIDSAKVDQHATTAVSLTQVEQLALDAHHAQIELSLARQRTEVDAVIAASDGPALPRLPDPAPPEALQPAAAFEASLARADAMRTEQARLLRELGTLHAPLRTARRQAEQAVGAAGRMGRETVARTARQHERALQSGLARLRVTPDDLAVAQAALAKTQASYDQQVDAAQAGLEDLRLSDPGANPDAEADPLSEQRVFRIEKAALTERIRHAQSGLERDGFRVGLAEHLNAIIAGEPAPEALRARFGALLDKRRSATRKQDLLVRCDGWRRSRSAAQKASAASAEVTERKDRLLQAFATLADLCMREEWVLDAHERLARIAHFHLDRQQVQNRTAWWYAWRIAASLLIFGLVVLITRWTGVITHRLARPPESKEPSPASRTKASEPVKLTWGARLAKIRGTASLLLYLALSGGLWFVASALTVEYVWGHPVEWSTWLGWLTHPIMTIADNPVSAWSLFSILMWIIGGLWLGRAFQGFLSEGLLDHFAVQRGVRDVVGTVARYVVIVLGIILGLSSAGIPLAALAAVFGVLGIGIGFGLQNIASNFISGFIILIERPFRRGDYIQVGDMVGEVKEIRARATTIETRDAVTVVVPNSEFVTGKVINWTLGHNERLRTQVSVGVAYGSDLQQVTRILLDIGRAHADVLGWPGPRVEMTGFGDSSINFDLHVWTRRLRTLPGLRSDLYLAIDAAFRAANIDIPFPIRTVMMADPETPDDAAPQDALQGAPQD